MIGRLFCLIWAHKRVFMFTNGAERAVFHCERCPWVRADES